MKIVDYTFPLKNIKHFPMKNIINPFAYYSEKTLLTIGIVSFTLLSLVAYGFNMEMNGIFHIGYAKEKTVWAILKQHLFIYGSACLLLILLAYLYNKKTRWIDVLNTVLVSSAPNILLVLLTGLPIFEQASENIISLSNQPDKLAQHKTELMLVLTSSLIAIPLLVYSIILLHNGYKTATHMKTWWQIALFYSLLFALNGITQFYF